MCLKKLKMSLYANCSSWNILLGVRSEDLVFLATAKCAVVIDRLTALLLMRNSRSHNITT